MIDSNLFDYEIPLAAFADGKAEEVFSEVRQKGIGIVVDKEKPLCVLMAPEKYIEIVELIEDFELFIEAEKRTRNLSDGDLLTSEQILNEFGIQDSELKDTDVEIE